MDWFGRLAEVRWILSGSTRSVVFLIKHLAWETVHDNAFVSKIGSESRSRQSSGCKHKPAARLEWFRRNFKFRCGNLEVSRRNSLGHGIQNSGDGRREGRGRTRRGRSSRRKLPSRCLIFLFRSTSTLTNGRQLRARVRSFESKAGARTLIYFVLAPVSAADRMAVLELIEEAQA